MSCCFKLVLQHYYMLHFYFFSVQWNKAMLWNKSIRAIYTHVYIYFKKILKHLCISPVDFELQIK